MLQSNLNECFGQPTMYIYIYIYVCMYVCMCVYVYIYTHTCETKSVSCLVMSDSSVTPWTVAHQASLSMEFSRQEYWSG